MKNFSWRRVIAGLTIVICGLVVGKGALVSSGLVLVDSGFQQEAP